MYIYIDIYITVCDIVIKLTLRYSAKYVRDCWVIFKSRRDASLIVVVSALLGGSISAELAERKIPYRWEQLIVLETPTWTDPLYATTVSEGCLSLERKDYELILIGFILCMALEKDQKKVDAFPMLHDYCQFVRSTSSFCLVIYNLIYI